MLFLSDFCLHSSWRNTQIKHVVYLAECDFFFGFVSAAWTGSCLWLIWAKIIVILNLLLVQNFSCLYFSLKRDTNKTCSVLGSTWHNFYWFVSASWVSSCLLSRWAGRNCNCNFVFSQNKLAVAFFLIFIFLYSNWKKQL